MFQSDEGKDFHNIFKLLT